MFCFDFVAHIKTWGKNISPRKKNPWLPIFSKIRQELLLTNSMDATLFFLQSSSVLVQNVHSRHVERLKVRSAWWELHFAKEPRLLSVHHF